MPYSEIDNTAWPSENAYKEAMYHKIGEVTWLDTTQAGTLDVMKQHLANGNIGFAGINVYNNFGDVNCNYNYCLADVTGSSIGAHSTTIIGYDDARVTHDGVGAFRCVNSWGTDWGDQGFYWLSYQAVTDPYNKIFHGYFTYWGAPDVAIPQYAARFSLNHSQFRDLFIQVGVGDPNSPTLSLPLWRFGAYDSWLSRNQQISAPSYPFWIDITRLSTVADGVDVFLGAETRPPTTPQVFSLAFSRQDPTTLYAGTYCGIFQSDDGGGSWGQPQLTNSVVRALTTDPSNPSTLYACGAPGGVFTSFDEGNSWIPTNNGITNAYVYALLTDPSYPTTLYAGTQDGVFKSTNGGSIWVPESNGLTNPYVYSLAIDSNNASTLYVATCGGGVFKTIDAGGSWSAVNNGLTDTIVWQLVIDPINHNTLYVGTGASGIYKTTDGGSHWAQTGLTNQNVFALVIDSETPDILYAGTYGNGIFKSANGGISWTSLSTGLWDFYVFALAIDPSDSVTLYAGTYGGIFKSIDGGNNWCPINNGMTFPYVSGQITNFSVVRLCDDEPSMSLDPPVTIPATSTWAVASLSPPIIAISPAGLPEVMIGTAYSQQLSASGGADPYGFTIIAGSLPADLSLSSGGALAGTPMAAGTSHFTVAATATNGCTGTQHYTLTITCPTITLSPMFLPVGARGATYYQTLSASGGTAPYAFTLASGSLPQGIDLLGDGLLSGTPSAISTSDFTVTVTDAYACAGSKAYSVKVTSGIPGDCDGDGQASIGEVQKAINMFLGSQAVGCGVDCNGDGEVSIGEVQKVINGFLGMQASC
jgi:photosystem II stability/assembly factor-like uncharacterized protein